MQFLSCITLFVLFPHVAAVDNSVNLLDDFNGVWTITSATDDGVDQPLAEDPDGSVSAGECELIEIIICENRVVIVSTDGDAMVGQIRVLEKEPQLKIELTGFGYHAKQDGPSYAILQYVDNNAMQFSFCSKDAKRINSAVGGQQFVLTAER